MINRRLAVVGALVLTVAVAGVAFAATVVVRPSSMDGWAFSTTGTASAGMVTGPGAPPLGTGSAQLSVGADGDSGARLRNSSHNGTLLARLTALSYSTYVQQDGSGGQAPYLILDVDLNADGAWDDLLFFEPVYQTGAYSGDTVPNQGSVMVGTWQEWDALAGGWWALSAGTFGPPLVTLENYVAAHPGARLASPANGDGSLRIVAGFGAGAWDNFVGNADAFSIGVDGNNTTYDFEPNLPQPPSKDACKKKGWMNYARANGSTFKNQGDCIQYVNTGK
ncbi:MAG TPA: hypothetical protein VM305_06060 [Candidatus Limnocylindrales bacterium]|jgi:hypothetical protein|nr:hypothetical protein [Candidatus Limnocylindrales bacterium]